MMKDPKDQQQLRHVAGWLDQDVINFVRAARRYKTLVRAGVDPEEAKAETQRYLFGEERVGEGPAT